MSQVLPVDVKRVRFFLDGRAESAANARAFILARPFGSTATIWTTERQVLLGSPNQSSGRVRLAVQSEGLTSG